MEVTTIGIDLAKSVFAVCGADASGKVVLRKLLRRAQVLPFFRALRPCLVGMEACGGAHWWARQLGELGHTVKMMNPHTVASYRSGPKHDFNDAEAACEAVTRARVRAVTPKSLAQQDLLALHRARQFLIKQHTGWSNQLRALLHERGITVAKGSTALRRTLAQLPEDNPDLSGEMRELLRTMGQYWEQCHQHIAELDAQLERKCRDDERCQRLDQVTGIGPIIATAVVGIVGNGSEFRRGRELSAYLGLVPGQHSSGGKTVLLGITKHGNRYLRTLLIHGARSALRTCAQRSDALSCWMYQVLQRQGANVAAVAVANKLARIIWALLQSGRSYDPRRAACAPSPAPAGESAAPQPAPHHKLHLLMDGGD